MKLINIHYFLAVAKELNITRAAQKLHISPQALSTQISNMEREYNVKFFERSPRLSLTYAGDCMVKFATELIDMEKQIDNQLKDISNQRRGKLSMGISRTYSRVLLPKLLPTYRTLYPNNDINLIIAPPENLKQLLMESQIDLILGITPSDQSDIVTNTIFTDNICLIVPHKIMTSLFPDNYSAMIETFKKSVDINYFRNEAFLMLPKGLYIRTMVDNYLSSNRITPHILLELIDMPTLISLCIQNMGITFVYKTVVQSEFSFLTEQEHSVHLFPIDSVYTRVKIALSYHQSRYLPHAAKDFLDLTRKILLMDNTPPGC